MAITVVGQASAAATSVAIPAHQAGDLIIVSARATVAPTVPTAGGTVPAWQTLQSSAAFSLGLTVVSFVATAGTTTTGAFTNATHIAVLVLRPGAGNSLLTNAAQSAVGGANNTQTIVYPALTLVKTNSTSMGVRVGTRTVAITAVGTAPSGWTNQTIQPAGASALMSVHTRAGLAANPTADSVTVTSSNAPYRAVTLEVQEIVPVTQFGVVARATMFGQTVAAIRKTFGVTARPVTFGAVTAGTIVAAGPQTYFGVSASSYGFTAVTAGRRTTFGVVAVPVTFTKAVQGARKTFGVVDRSTVFTKAVQGVRKTFGVVAIPITFTKAVSGIAITAPKYGIVARPITFGAVTQGQRTALGVVARPVTFGAATQGRRKTFGVVARPVVVTFVTTGTAPQRFYGVVTAAFTFAAATRAQPKLTTCVEISNQEITLLELGGNVVDFVEIDNQAIVVVELDDDVVIPIEVANATASVLELENEVLPPVVISPQ